MSKRQKVPSVIVEAIAEMNTEDPTGTLSQAFRRILNRNSDDIQNVEYVVFEERKPTTEREEREPAWSLTVYWYGLGDNDYVKYKIPKERDSKGRPRILNIMDGPFCT